MRVLLRGGTAEIVEKRSRFIADTAVVRSEEEAAAFLEGIRKKYWDAKHHCSAYILGGGRMSAHSSDDGEPSGTAGRPILDVVSSAGLQDIIIVVTRYFGGTLLGTGGLVRAYSGAAKAGLDASVIADRVDGELVTVRTGYDFIGKLQYLAAARELTQAGAEYGEGVAISYYVPADAVDSFSKAVTEATAGKAKIEREGGISFAVTKDGVVLL